MAVFGICMMRDEADVAEGVLRHMAAEVDRLIVADNNSTDGTSDILASLVGVLPLIVLPDPVVAYRQAAKMTQLANMAAQIDDDDWTFVVPFDADELWFSSAGRVREVLVASPDRVVGAELHHHVRTGADLVDPDPFRSMVWRQDQAASLPKVAFRWRPGAALHQGNHGVSLPGGRGVGPARPLSICHFPVRSLEHYHRKSINGGEAYAAAPDIVGGEHWKSWAALSEEQRTEAYNRWWHFPNPTEVGMWHDIGLIKEPAPYRRWPS